MSERKTQRDVELLLRLTSKQFKLLEHIADCPGPFLLTQVARELGWVRTDVSRDSPMPLANSVSRALDALLAKGMVRQKRKRYHWTKDQYELTRDGRMAILEVRGR